MLAFAGFILTIAILVIVHEFGHYVFARLFNVKVITFSIGFGPKLFKWQGKHNQWCISAIPLGGYVEMLDSRSAPVADELKNLDYNHKPPLQKLLIAFAGPLFNILFAFIAYYFLGLYGITALKPIIQSINPTPLVLNLTQIQPNTTITKIDNASVNSWNQADKLFSQAVSKNSHVNLTLVHAKQTQNINLDLNKYLANSNDDTISLSDLGIYPFNYQPTISYVEPQSPADRAGLKEGDEIIAINQSKISSWLELIKIIKASPSNRLSMTVQNHKQIRQLDIIPDSSTDDNGQIIGKIGIMPTLDAQLLEQNSFTLRYNGLNSFGYAYQACTNLIVGNLTVLQYMLQGKISWHNLGGPVTIAEASKTALRQGVKSFIDLLALISLGLAVMNLLPIPVLDGGHILLYLIEWIRGKPLAINTQLLLFKIGMVVVLGIMFLALYNDFLKMFNV